MHVAIESPQTGITVVRPQGTLDMNSVPAFRQTLEVEVQRAQRGLIVALSEVAFMDSVTYDISPETGTLLRMTKRRSASCMSP